MLRGLKRDRYNHFKYYVRQCKDCSELFKADGKKCKYCNNCKMKRTEIKIVNSLKARGFTYTKREEVKNVSTKLDSQFANVK